MNKHKNEENRVGSQDSKHTLYEIKRREVATSDQSLSFYNDMSLRGSIGPSSSLKQGTFNFKSKNKISF